MLEQRRQQAPWPFRQAAKPAPIQGNMTAKQQQRQSHRISLLADFKQRSPFKMLLDRTND
jgi:hypothetical protein